MDWDDIRVFLAVARSNGLTGAARLLRSSPQTVGRRVIALEADLGSALFLRGPNGYELTDDGRSLLADAENVEQDIARFRVNATGRSTSLSGTVRLAAAENFVIYLLLPTLKEFLDRNPALKIEFVTGIAPVSMARGDADLALRLVRPTSGELTVRRVGTMVNALYVAPSYFTANPEPSEKPLERGPVIGWDETYNHLPAAQWLASHLHRRPDLTFTSLASQRAAVAAGLGMGFLPCFLADGLERVPCDDGLSEPIWLIGHSASVESNRIRAVYDEVILIMSAAQKRLGGEEWAAIESIRES